MSSIISSAAFALISLLLFDKEVIISTFRHYMIDSSPKRHDFSVLPFPEPVDSRCCD